MNISKTWDVNPMEFIPVVQDDISKITVDLAEKIFYGVVSRTPVYTGDLRASWIAETYESTSVNVGGSKDSPLPPPTFPAHIRGLKPTMVYIMNSTPYAGLVEFGGPTNIPRAMVQLTLNSL